MVVETIVRRLRDVDDSGSTELADGTLLVRKIAPRPTGIFPNAYLHEIYPPLEEAQVARLQRLIGRELPPALRRLYAEANGLYLFCGSLSIRGLATDMRRSPNIREPVSLEYGNVVDRPKTALSPTEVRFGFFSSAEAELVADLHRSAIYAVPRYQAGPILFEWEDLETLISSEVDRMIHLYSQRKGKVDPMDPLPAPWE